MNLHGYAPELRPLLERLRADLGTSGWDAALPALGLAGRIHGHERRPLPGGGEGPFLVHPIRLALILTEEARTTDPVLIAGALCHDVLEHDRRLTWSELVTAVGPQAARLTLALSVPHKLNPGESPSASRVNYLDGLVRAGPGALLVKAADRLDNLRHRTQAGPPERLATMKRQDLADYLPLLERHLGPEGRPLIERIRLLAG